MICETCHGTGAIDNDRRFPDPCPDCGGSGIVSCCDPARGYEAGEVEQLIMGDCPECGRSSRILGFACEHDRCPMFIRQRQREAWASLPEGVAEDLLCYGMTMRKITKDGVERIPPAEWDANAIAAALDQASPPDEEDPPPPPEPDARDHR